MLFATKHFSSCDNGGTPVEDAPDAKMGMPVGNALGAKKEGCRLEMLRAKMVVC